MRLFGRSKKELITWQNLVFEEPSTILHSSEFQLKEITPSIFQRHLEIANDSIKLFQTTANPEVFFLRYDTFIKECQRQYDKIVVNFIDRYWEKTNLKAVKLKTENGKQNCYKKF